MTLNHRDFEEYLKDNNKNIYYDVGHAVVKPILDKDIDKGIEILIENPPTKKDLEDILGYRQMILNMMELKWGYIILGRIIWIN